MNAKWIIPIHVYLRIQVSGLFLGSLLLAVTQPLLADSIVEMITFVPTGMLIGFVITAIPTAIFSVVLSLAVLLIAPLSHRSYYAYLFAATLTVVVFFSVFGLLKEKPRLDDWPLFLSSISASFLGTQLLLKKLTLANKSLERDASFRRAPQG